MACFSEGRTTAPLQGSPLCQAKDVFQNQGGTEKGWKGGHTDNNGCSESGRGWNGRGGRGSYTGWLLSGKN